MSPIPVYAYGGTERVIWDLARSLVELGHSVTFLVPAGSYCDFAEVVFINSNLKWHQQIPKNIDIVHFQFQPLDFNSDIPFLITEHGNAELNKSLNRNTVFVSQNHAIRHGSECFVYNGLDWRNYGDVDWNLERNYYHFLGKAAWRVKNVKGAISVAQNLKEQLHVLGGNRFNFKRGIRLTFSSHIQFHGMVGGQKKREVLQGSKGLIFPVTWHEPFGLAIIESLYFGCPVFSTPYGAIPELVPNECGFLTHSSVEMCEAIKIKKYDSLYCHNFVKENFNSLVMAKNYIKYYNKVINQQSLNMMNPQLKNTSENLSWF